MAESEEVWRILWAHQTQNRIRVRTHKPFVIHIRILDHFMFWGQTMQPIFINSKILFFSVAVSILNEQMRFYAVFVGRNFDNLCMLTSCRCYFSSVEYRLEITAIQAYTIDHDTVVWRSLQKTAQTTKIVTSHIRDAVHYTRHQKSITIQRVSNQAT